MACDEAVDVRNNKKVKRLRPYMVNTALGTGRPANDREREREDDNDKTD